VYDTPQGASRRVVVIGGGGGGLAAAALLARAGHRVTLLERGAEIGGKIGEHRAGGFRFDTGPTLLTMPWVFDEFFAALGERRDEHLPLHPLDPLCRYTFADGSRLDLHADPDARRQALRAFAPGEEVALDRYLAHVARMYEISEDVFLRNPFTVRSVARFIRPRFLRDLPSFTSGTTLHALNRRYFRDPRLVQLFDRFATYNGSSPMRTPATFGVISHVELAQGGFTPTGGMRAVARSLAAAAERAGVEIRTGEEAVHVAMRGSGPAAVHLASGAELPADAVVVNQDAITALGTLFADAARVQPLRRRMERREPSSSGFVILAGVRGRRDELAMHNIFFSGAYAREFDELFDARRPIADPTVYVSISARAHPADAPADAENWFVLVNAPALAPGVDWSGLAPAYRDRVFDVLARHGLDPRTGIEVEHLITPADLAARDLAFRGALYGHASHSKFSAFLRPPIAPRPLPGVFFTGGTTHPGGGVPMVVLSAQIAARAAGAWLEKKFRKEI
jgi:phytoene desaturase